MGIFSNLFEKNGSYLIVHPKESLDFGSVTSDEQKFATPSF